jgi:hypothetical protein
MTAPNSIINAQFASQHVVYFYSAEEKMGLVYLALLLTHTLIDWQPSLFLYMTSTVLLPT